MIKLEDFNELQLEGIPLAMISPDQHEKTEALTQQFVRTCIGAAKVYRNNTLEAGLDPEAIGYNTFNALLVVQCVYLSSVCAPTKFWERLEVLQQKSQELVAELIREQAEKSQPHNPTS